jgi:hypothetical protein
VCDDNNVYFDRAAAAVVQIYNDDDKGGYRYGPSPLLSLHHHRYLYWIWEREDNGQDIDTVWVPSGIYKRGEKVVGRVGRESFLYSTIDRSILGIEKTARKFFVLTAASIVLISLGIC